MKKFSLLLVALSFALCGMAQNQKGTHKVGIQAGYFAHQLQAVGGPLTGGPSYSGKQSFSFGMNYNYFLTKRLSLSTGLNFQRYNGETTPAPGLNSSESVTPAQRDVLSIPIGARFYLHRFFYLTGGMQIDRQVADKQEDAIQNGIGVFTGLGAEFSVQDRFNLAVQPTFNWHALANNGEGENHRKVQAIGINLLISRNF